MVSREVKRNGSESVPRGVLPNILGGSVSKTLTLFQTEIYDFPYPFSDQLKQPLIASSNPMTFHRGLFSFSICFEDECPWSMSK